MLLESVAGVRVPEGRAELGSVDLSQVTSPAYAADVVVVVKNDGAVAAAIIVEVQLRRDPDKRLSWPVYVAALRAAHDCPVFLLVIAPKNRVARWARTSIELGHPGFVLVPLVMQLDELPESSRARNLPELAVLSALAHPGEATVKAALEAVEPLAEDMRALYVDYILAALPGRLRSVLEEWMHKREPQSWYAKRYYKQGREEGRAEGLREAILTAASARLGETPSETITVLQSLADLEVLERVLREIVEAEDANAVAAILARL